MNTHQSRLRAVAAEREADALRYIHQCVSDRGYPPSRRELAEHLGAPSSETAQRILHQLQTQGLVEVVANTPRGLRITNAGMKAIGETA